MNNSGSLILKIKTVCVISALFLMTQICTLYALQNEVSNSEFRPFSPREVKAFLARIIKEKSDYSEFLKKEYASSPNKVSQNAQLKAYDQIIADTQKLLVDLKVKTDHSDKQRRFIEIQRLHNDILGNIAEKPIGKLEDYVKRTGNIVGGSLILAVPDVCDPNAKIGPQAAELESKGLYRPGDIQPVELKKLAEMSAFQISRLQPAKDHPAMSAAPPGNHYDSFLQEMKNLVRLQDEKLARFDFQYSKRVLYCSKLAIPTLPSNLEEKVNAALTKEANKANPKLAVRDRFGLKWQIKWGPETHTDVALSRLYIDLGGTCTDIKLYSGPGETILVFAPPTATAPDALHTFSELCQRILTKSCGYDPSNYLLPEPVIKDSNGSILGTGKVDEAMRDRESIDPKFIGAYYVKFKECQLSFFCPAVKGLCDVPLNTGKALSDRVHRGSLVFNAWIKNLDMKSNNSRAGLIYNPKTRAFDRLVEFQYDLGYSLGAYRAQGELNSFEKSFIFNLGQEIHFNMHPIFLPEAWKKCTWADARWMALRIAAFSRSDLERCFAESGWPFFAQRVAVERLLSRRNELVKAFKLEADRVKEIACNPDFILEMNVNGTRDFPVGEGAIYDNSIVVKELEKTIHPEGLAKVVGR